MDRCARTGGARNSGTFSKAFQFRASRSTLATKASRASAIRAPRRPPIADSSESHRDLAILQRREKRCEEPTAVRSARCTLDWRAERAVRSNSDALRAGEDRATQTHAGLGRERHRVHVAPLGVPTLQGEGAGDPDEGLFSLYASENPTLRIVARVGGTEIPMPRCSIRINGTSLDHAVYCMRGIEVPGDGNVHSDAFRAIADDPRIEAFGDTLLVFRDTSEFVRRMMAAAEREGLELDHGPVEYVPIKHCGEMGPFRKRAPYAWQSEIRFVTATPIEGESLVLNLGCLLDIAFWIDLRAARVA